ncbi:hypothetical protein RRG08_032626 [Elysia crispata]|uniref:Uncharacterized protein n=1 Tax=Elysia crispata TaxID=231223 RepID=A0AAE1CPZ2_9GAST|nr:hypothetical protein RRG08_032626 [Elysia crispata]
MPRSLGASSPTCSCTEINEILPAAVVWCSPKLEGNIPVERDPNIRVVRHVYKRFAEQACKQNVTRLVLKRQVVSRSGTVSLLGSPQRFV